MQPIYRKYSEVRSEINHADGLFFRRGWGLVGLFISRWTQSDYTHVGKAAWIYAELRLLEVREFFGGRDVPLSEQVRKYPGRIDVFAIISPADPVYRRTSAVRHMRGLVEGRYGYWNILKIALGYLFLVRFFVKPATNDNEARRGSPFCSQAVAEADRMGGGVDPVPNKADRAVTPGMLASSRLYQYRYTLVPDETELSHAESHRAQKKQDPRGIFCDRTIHAFCVALILLVLLPQPADGQLCGPAGCGPTGCPPTTSTRPMVGVLPSFQQQPRQSQWIPVTTNASAYASVVRVERSTSSGPYLGSGVVILRQGRPLLLTAAHVVEDADTVTMRTLDGQSILCRIIYRDELYDFAIGLPQTSRPLTTANTAQTPLDIGTPVWACAYSYGQTLGLVRGSVRGWSGPANPPNSAMHFFDMSGNVNDGCSGGPVFNESGRVVGILWGADGEFITAVRIELVVTALEQLRFSSGGQAPSSKTPPLIQEPATATKTPSVVPPASTSAPPALAPVVITQPQEQGPDGHPPTVPEDTDEGNAGALPLDVTAESIATTAILYALGGAGLSGGGLAIAVPFLVRGANRWRKSRKRQEVNAPASAKEAPAEPGAAFQRDTTEAEELLQLAQVEGRSAVLDAFVGMSISDELETIIEVRTGEPEAAWAKALQRTLKDRLDAVAPVVVYETQHNQGV